MMKTNLQLLEDHTPDSFSSEIYRTIVNRMEQGVLVYNAEKILGANDQLCSLLDCPTELVRTGIPLEQFIQFGAQRGDYDGDGTLTLAAMRMRIAAGKDYVVERNLPDGRTIRIDCRHMGNIGIGTYTDITKVIDEKAVLANTVETMAQGLLVHDRHSIIIANNRLNEVLDLPEGLAQTGKSWRDMVQFRAERGDYEDYETHIQNIQQVFNEKTGFTVESRAGSKTVRTEVRFANGLMFVTFTDVTDARKREVQLLQKEAEVRKLADTDGLTGLGNRRAFDTEFQKRFEELSQTSRHRELALIFVDLDHFKPVNDTYGHSFGDALLEQIAERFSKTIRSNDKIARIGGDEFAAIVQVNDKLEAKKIAYRLRDAARKPVLWDDAELRVDATVGMTYLSDGFDNAKDMIVAADLALYAAKNENRGTVREYEPHYAVEAKEKFLLQQDLKLALENDEFVLHYQAQMDLRTDKIIGFEALLRWDHPQRGLVSPTSFIGIAEEAGLIVPIGRWALRQATKDIGALSTPMRVAVNVSPMQFAKSNIIEDISTALNESGLPAQLLEIEITEDVMIDEKVNLLETLQELRAMGVGITLDDFGSGYSSLAYLTKYPFSKLKIDKQFIDQMILDERSEALVASILSLASSLGMRVTAEGVETKDQFERLIQGECDEAQGFLLAKPMALSDLMETFKLQNVS